MGDSYASGTGGGDYWPAWNDPGTNECRRSQNSYAWDIAVSADLQVSFVACFGATTADLGPGKADDSPPGNEIDQFAALDETVDLVTISIGGNDVYFGKVIFHLVALNTCSWLATLLDPYDPYDILPGFCTVAEYLDLAYWQPKVEDALAQLGPKLETVYREIRERAPNALIEVVGYPRFFGSDWFCPSAAISSGNRNWLNEKATELNAVIQAAIGSSGVQRITYVPGSDTAFSGHEICTDDPWFNSPAGEVGDFFEDLFNGLEYWEAFHPNEDGYDRLASLLFPQPTILTLHSDPIVNSRTHYWRILYYQPPTQTYDTLRLDVRDFYTQDLVDRFDINLDATQRQIGVRQVAQSLSLSRAGFFEATARLMDCSGGGCVEGPVSAARWFTVWEPPV
ncbi:MAG: SGNH/GDSL hydrolase family protein, partial [Actinomycetota bacterium]